MHTTGGIPFVSVTAAGRLCDGVKTSGIADHCAEIDVDAGLDELGADAKDGFATVKNLPHFAKPSGAPDTGWC